MALGQRNDGTRAACNQGKQRPQIFSAALNHWVIQERIAYQLRAIWSDVAGQELPERLLKQIDEQFSNKPGCGRDKRRNGP